MRKSGWIACVCVPALSTTCLAAGPDASNLTERTALLMIQLGVILFAAKLGHMLLSQRCRMPGVLGEVLAGVIIGPHVLGGIAFYVFPHGLFPPSNGFPVSPELYGICGLAAVILLFTIGLETDLRLFLRYSMAATVVGIGGVLFSFVLGNLVTVAFSRSLFGVQLDWLAPQALFLGVISTATSVGITARILAEKRKLDSPEGVTILGGAVIDDVLGIVLLAVVLGIIGAAGGSRTIHWARIGGIAGKAVGIWLVTTVIGLLASRRIGFLLKLFRAPLSIALMGLGLALIVSGLFEHAGLATIVGAYIMGLSLSRTDIKHVVQEGLAPISAFLVPVFFCVMGMLIDFRMLASKEVLLFGAAYAGTAILAKVLGCGLPMLLFGFNLRGAMRIGIGMMPRCEVALTIAGIGLAKGVISQDVVGVSVVLMIATTLLAPPALVALFSNNKRGTRKTPPRASEQALTFSFPSPEIVDLLVPKLVAVFESEGFFAHLLDRAERTYQLRKNDMIVGFRQGTTDVQFHCRASEVPLVNTAMYEVVAELQRTISGLQAPLDNAAIARRVQDEIPTTTHGLRMGDYIRIETLVPNMRASNKQEMIEGLLALLDRQGMILDIEKARSAIWERERSMSTGMQHGIAIPHARTDAVKKLVCAVSTHSDGIDFGAIDNQPSRIFVLTLSPADNPAPHVQFMSVVGTVLDEDGRRRLLACQTPRDMRAVLATRPNTSESPPVRG